MAGKRARGGKRDSDAPKKPLTSYLLFAQEKRSEILKEKPELRSKVTDVGKMIGEAWRCISEDQKQLYVERAAQARVKYEKELAAYKQRS